MESLQGYLLVASPELGDPNFHKTVVLIVRHSPTEGSLGLVLNRQTSTSVRELWERMGQENCRRDTPLSLGGPCEGPLMALHTNAKIAEIEVLPGLYFSASSDQLRALICDDDAETPARFFFGYAGWGAGQLEMELQAGAWRTEPTGLRHVFAVQSELWERSISEAAGWEVLAALRIKDVPVDPSRN
jgi:putative transcriptional regulator